MSARLYNRKTGQVEEVPDDQVTSLVASGSHGFEKGLKLPVVGDDGGLYDLPSENAEQAFKSGLARWKTPEDTRAYLDQENEKILQKNFGDTPGALGSQFLSSYTFGLGDIAAQKYADAVYGEGKGEEYAQARKIKKELSPGLTLAGDVLGIVGAPSKAIKVLGEAKELGQAAGYLPKLAKAETALGRIGQRVLKEAGDGAVFGLGQGISEAALGDPDEVAQNLAASTAMGGLFGGVFGAGFGAFKEVAPTAKAIVSKTAEAVDNAFQAGVRKAVKKTGDYVLSGAENAEMRKMFGDAVEEPELRQLFQEQGLEKLKDLKGQIKTGERLLKEEQANTQRAFERYLKNKPKEIRDAIQADGVQLAGDLQSKIDDMGQRLTGEKANLEAQLRASGGGSDRFRQIYSNAEKAISRLETDKVTAPLAKELRAWLDGQGAARGMANTLPEHAVPLSLADERNMLLEFRSMVKDAVDSSPEVKSRALGLLKNTDAFLHSSPAYGGAQKAIDKLERAKDAVADFVLNQSGKVKGGLIKKILVDGSKYDEVLSNVSQLVPELEAFRAAGKDLTAQNNALQSVKTRIKEITAGRATGESLTSGQLKELLTDLKAGPDLMDRLERLQTVTQALQSQGATPATKYLAIQGALGNPIDKEALKLLQHGEWFRKLEKHFSKEYSDRGTIDKLVGLVTKRGVRSLAGAAIGGGITGDSTGAILGASAAGMVNPYLVLKNLTRLESISTQSAKRFEKATEAVINALTSEKGIRLGVGTAVKARSLKDARKDYKQRAEYLNKLANDPEALADEFENRFGDMQQTPSISASMMQQFAKTSQFLASKLPKDPLAGKYLSAFQSKWQPTDHQLAEFERYTRAAEDPIGTIEEMARGKMSTEAIETLKTLNPVYFSRLQRGVMDAIMKPEANPSYKQKLLMANLFEIPADPTLSPSFVNTMQSTYQEQAQSGQSQPGMDQKKSVHIDINPEAVATETTRLTNS